MIRVLVADDQALVRAGFRAILDAQEDVDVVGEAADGAEAVALARELRPDVVLMDVRMPGVDGIEATRRLLRDVDAPRVLMLTTFDMDEYVYAALKAGASGFLLKDAPRDQLVSAVRTIAAGDALLAPSVVRRLVDGYVSGPAPGSRPRELDVLTERERDVLMLIARGCTNAEIASHLFLSEATVRTHVTHILGKLDLRSRIQAVVLAYETGLVRPGRADDEEATAGRP
ncbi:MAG: response regulator [Pseudomonadota bacterium]